MAYKVIRATGSVQGIAKRLFVCDAESDIASLPTNKKKGAKQPCDTVSDEICAIGSIADVVESGNRYKLNASGEWIKQPSESGGEGEPGFSPTIVENQENDENVYKLDITTKDSTFTTPNLKGTNGAKGEDGFSPTIVENADNTDSVYKLDITTKEGTLTTPNLIGPSGGSTPTPADIPIESISVNGVNIEPVDKNVDITVPTKISDLEDDGTFVSDGELAEVAFSGSYNDLQNVPESLPASDVYDWAKQENKPAYTADEVGALPNDADVPINFVMERHNQVEASPIIDVKYGDPQEIKFSFYSPKEHFDGSTCFIADELASFYGDLGGSPTTYNMQPWTDENDVADLTVDNGPYLVLTTKYSENTSDTSSNISMYTYVISLKDKVVDYITNTKQYSELTTTAKTIIGAINELDERLTVTEV